MIRDRVKELRRVKASELRKHPKNWRIHPESQRRGLTAALREIGFADALIARETTAGLELIDGHLRQDLAGDAMVPVLVLDVNEEEATKLLVTLDPLAAMAEPDKDMLRGLLDSIKTEDEEVKRLIEEIAERERVLGAGKELDDPGPGEPLAEPVTRPGDLWLMGDHRLLCADSTKAEDVARLMAGEKAALLSTDPPYCVDYTGMDRPIHDGKPSGKDWSHVYREVDIEDLGEFLDAAFEACLPHIREDAAIYVWHAHVQQPAVAAAFERHGLLLHQIIVWVKPTATFGHSFYRWRHEPCAFGWRRGHKPAHGYGALDTVWEVDWEGKQRVVGNEHPTMKPTRLFEIPMEQHTKRGAIVLEPFSGSGSQIIAAEKLGRKCRAMEISPAFVDVALRRWEGATGKAAQLDGTGQTFTQVAEKRGQERLEHQTAPNMAEVAS